MRRYTYILVFLLLGYVTAPAQVVWPGDVNNNGIVNGVDVLYVGLAYGSLGPERIAGSETWEAQNISSLWGTAFPDGIDYAYADCNGDGQVDGNDLFGVIEENFGLTHRTPQGDGFSNGAAGVHPAFVLEPSMTTTQWGATLNIDLRLGTEGFPASNFYGVALKMSYTPDVIDQEADDDGFDFDAGDNIWISSEDDDEVEYLFYKDHNTGKAELAITRINQNFVAQGSGSIGQFSVVVEDIIVGAERDSFSLQIDSILYLDDQFNVYPIVPDTTLIIIRDSSSSVTSTDEENPAMSAHVYPNPAGSYFMVETSRPVDEINVYSAVGELMPLFVKQSAFGTVEVRTDQWPDGFYYLKLSLDNQTVITKIAVASGRF